MDSLVARAAPPTTDTPDSANMRVIKEAFRTADDQGVQAGIEVLLNGAHADCEFRPYIAADQVFVGHEEVRRYYGEAIAAGSEMRLNPTSFHEDGDEVVVHGSIRVARPTGGFSESQISWVYRFRDGRLAAAGWSPRTGAS